MDLDVVPKLTCLSLDLNTIMEVLLEGSTVKDTVTRGARVVDNKLVLCSSLSGGRLGLTNATRRPVSAY